MSFEKTWRWYGPNDPITLKEIVQTGATGIVSALHHIPNGQVWKEDDILKHKELIEEAGLTWSVVESVPVHEDIKKQKGDYKLYIENYKQSIRNLGKCGIKTICYNFMPILDWSRTNIEWKFKDGSKALHFSIAKLAAFDIYILKREGAASSYTEQVQADAKNEFESMDDVAIKKLCDTMLLGLPGAEESFTVENFKEALAEYNGIDREVLKKHLYEFIREIMPVAEESGVFMGIHPDDPPVNILGLPRVVSTIDDTEEFLAAYDSPNNGVTFCSGSWGAGHFNDMTLFSERLAQRVNFIHLRNVTARDNGDFYEDNHLEGSVDMYAVMKNLLIEQHRREVENLPNKSMPLRPDHGHQMLYDLEQAKTNPGYTLIGRMKGLAELTGLEMGIERELKNKN